ncbi:MAG: peptidoglycan-binding domain-containing protein [Rhodospirillaceae bacterium]
MPSEQHLPAPHPHLPLDMFLAVDVDVGWRVGLTTLPGQSRPPDGYPLNDTDNVTAAFELEFTALLADPLSLREMKEAVRNALLLRLNDFGTEFYIQEFGFSFYREAMCRDCAGKPECAQCNKTGWITEVFRPHLVGLCTVKAAQESTDFIAIDQATGKPALPGSGGGRSRQSLKRWLLTVPVAALATVVMAISIGLRTKYDSETPKRVPELVRSELVRPDVARPDLVRIEAAKPETLHPGVVAEPSPAPPPAQSESQPRSAPNLTVPGPVIPIVPAMTMPVDPVRKPGPRIRPPIVELPDTPSAAHPVTAPAGPEPNKAVVRLQTALTSLQLYQGPISGVFDEPTRHALSQFTARVPPVIKARFGARTAAMAEAAANHEFTLK